MMMVMPARVSMRVRCVVLVIMVVIVTMIVAMPWVVMQVPTGAVAGVVVLEWR